MNYCGNITKSVMLWEIFVDLLMSDDLESLVYVLIWMCVLYAGPGTPRKDVRIIDTVLRPWVTVTNAIDAVNLGAIKQGMKIQPSNVTDEFTPYFKPLCPVVEKLLVELRGWLSSNDTDDRPHYEAVRNILLEGHQEKPTLLYSTI